MAFKQDINIPSGGQTPGVMPGDKSTSTRLDVLGGIMDTVGSVANNLVADQRKKDTDSVVADSIVGIMNLQQEREDALHLQDTVQARMRQLASDDGEISEADREALQDIQGDIEFLDQARKSGVLNRNAYSVRYNELMRRSLARAENLGIQSEIAGMFANNRTQTLAAPTMSETEKQAVAFMDSMFPQGWTQEQMAEELGKRQWAESLLMKEGLSATDVGMSFSVKMDQLMRAVTSTEGRLGRTITPEEQNNVLQGVQAEVSGYRQRLMAKRKQLMAKGAWTPSVQKQYEDSLNAINESAKFYSDDIWKTELYKSAGLEETLRSYSVIAEQYRSLNQPLGSAAFELLGGQGANGGILGMGLSSGLMTDDVTLEIIAENSGGRFANAQEVKAMYGRAMAYASVRGVDILTAIEQSAGGAVFEPEIMKMIGANIIKQPIPAPTGDSDTEKVRQDAVKTKVRAAAVTFPVRSGDVAGNTKNLASWGKSLSTIWDDAKKTGNEAVAKNATLNYIRRQALELQGFIKDNGLGTVIFTEDGRFVVPEVEFEDPAFGRQGPRLGTPTSTTETNRRNRQVIDHIKVLDSVIKNAASMGIIQTNEISDMFSVDLQTPDPVAPRGRRLGTLPDQADLPAPMTQLERADVEQRLERLKERAQRSPTNKRIQGDIAFLEDKLFVDDEAKVNSPQRVVPGTTMRGGDGVVYKFKGGDPSQEVNWEVAN